jgi:6-pyruvoyltetrahydropterin/6-carboxytetrahydropterin synthase
MTPVMDLFATFELASARTLPALDATHPCSRLHGHTFTVILTVRGPLDPRLGWVMDFADVERAWAPLKAALDHVHLNTVPGLENATTEHLALFIWERLAPALPLLHEVEVRESGRSGVRYRG